MDADFLFTYDLRKAAGHGVPRDVEGGHRRRGRPARLACSSTQLMLLNDVMLERKHTWSLNTSALLERSDMGVDGWMGTGMSSFAAVPAASGL